MYFPAISFNIKYKKLFFQAHQSLKPFKAQKSITNKITLYVFHYDNAHNVATLNDCLACIKELEPLWMMEVIFILVSNIKLGEWIILISFIFIIVRRKINTDIMTLMF